MVQLEKHHKLWQRKFSPSQNADSRKNHRGFTLIAFCVLLPFLMVLTSGAASLAISMRHHIQKQSLCENFVFHIQDELSKKMNALMKLNPRAVALRRTHRAARLRLAAALTSGHPVAIAAARARVMAIEMKRAQLHAEQQSLLLEAQQLKVAFQIKAPRHTEGGQLLAPLKGLAVRPDVPAETAPVYVTDEPFRLRQKINLHYSMRTTHQIRILNCAASMEKRGFFYRATLAGS